MAALVKSGLVNRHTLIPEHPKIIPTVAWVIIIIVVILMENRVLGVTQQIQRNDGNYVMYPNVLPQPRRLLRLLRQVQPPPPLQPPPHHLLRLLLFRLLVNNCVVIQWMKMVMEDGPMPTCLESVKIKDVITNNGIMETPIVRVRIIITRVWRTIAV